MRADGVLLLAHGTVSSTAELPGFLTRIRRGRAPSPELIHEMTQRYDAIGGSPLLRLTQEQAAALSEQLGLPCFVAMRLWDPSVEQALVEAAKAGVTRLCMLPLAPFSTDVYNSSAQRAQTSLEGDAAAIQLLGTPAWGEDAAFVRASAQLIERHLPTHTDAIVLTAHSLPMAVIEAGDGYAEQSARCAELIGTALGRPVHLAYQSEGQGGGRWLGPSLNAVLDACRQRGEKQLVVAPFGFLADHVETLYDLDIEAQQLARELGLTMTRVPALNADPAFIAALADIARATLAPCEKASSFTRPKE